MEKAFFVATYFHLAKSVPQVTGKPMMSYNKKEEDSGKSYDGVLYKEVTDSVPIQDPRGGFTPTPKMSYAPVNSEKNIMYKDVTTSVKFASMIVASSTEENPTPTPFYYKDYGVLYRNATDEADFDDEDEGEQNMVSYMKKKPHGMDHGDGNDGFHMHKDLHHHYKKDGHRYKRKFIGFSPGSSSKRRFNDFTFPKDDDSDMSNEEEDSLMELARKRHREEKRRKKIVFAVGKKKNRANKSIPEDSPLWEEGGNEFEREVEKEDESRFPNFPADKIKNLGTLMPKKKHNHVKRCLHLAEVPNGRLKCRGNVTMEGKDSGAEAKYFSPGSVCVLTCDPGFATAGEETATCDTSGAWMSNSRLECHEAVALLLGGWNPKKGLLDDAEVFDPRPGSKCGRVRVPPLPESRRGAVAGWVGGRVVLCGGANGTSTAGTDAGSNSRCFVYNAGLERWEETSSGMTEERHFAAATKIGERMVALGGRSGGDKPMALGSAESYGGGEGRWRMEKALEMTQERAYHCAAAAGDDSVVVTGGYSYNSVVAMAQVYNITARMWNPVGASGNLNQARYLHGCASVSQPGSAVPAVLVAGGYADGYLRSSELFDPRHGRWSRTGQLRIPRQGGAIAVLAGGDAVVMLGGFHSMTEFPREVERFEMKEGRWYDLSKEIRTPRRYFAMAHVPRSLFGC